MNKYYFTFGVSHPYHDRYVLVRAEDETTAREVMFAAHGSFWCGCYTEAEFTTGRCQHYVRLVSLHQNDPAIEVVTNIGATCPHCYEHYTGEAYESDDGDTVCERCHQVEVITDLLKETNTTAFTSHTVAWARARRQARRLIKDLKEQS